MLHLCVEVYLLNFLRLEFTDIKLGAQQANARRAGSKQKCKMVHEPASFLCGLM